MTITKQFNVKAMAKILAGIVNTLPNTKTAYFSPKEFLFRFISFNAEMGTSWGVNKDQSIYLGTSEMFTSRHDLELSIESYLRELEATDEIAFINSDMLTKAVLVYTEGYLDKLVSGERHLGEAIQNYFNIWHLGKSGVTGPSGTRKHHERYGTFSKAEVQNLSEGYIPIAVAPRELPIFIENLELILGVSTLAEYMKVETGANPMGVAVAGSRSWWIPKIVAKEYLQETDDLRVLSKRVLYKALYDAGLYEAPASTEVREINITSLDTKTAKERVSERASMALISNDFRVSDVESTRKSEISPDAIDLGDLDF